jgi:hypothetical protein
MAGLDSVICPRCRVGFAPDTISCPICRGPLVSDEGLEEDYEETPAPILLDDDVESLKELRTAGTDWIHHLQDKLAEAGIPHRIEMSGHHLTVCSVYVRPGDLGRATEIDSLVYAREVPDAEKMPRLEQLDFWACPACGNRLGEKDLTCGSCGLFLDPTETPRCLSCGEKVEMNLEACPRCGTPHSKNEL